jgi:hypothetical protein
MWNRKEHMCEICTEVHVFTFNICSFTKCNIVSRVIIVTSDSCFYYWQLWLMVDSSHQWSWSMRHQCLCRSRFQHCPWSHLRHRTASRFKDLSQIRSREDDILFAQERSYYCYYWYTHDDTLTQNQVQAMRAPVLLLLCLVKWTRRPRALRPVGVSPHWPQLWTLHPPVRAHRSAILTASPRRTNRLAAPQPAAAFRDSRSQSRRLWGNAHCRNANRGFTIRKDKHWHRYIEKCT